MYVSIELYGSWVMRFKVLNVLEIHKFWDLIIIEALVKKFDYFVK